MVDYPDIINFSRDELLDEYCKLFDRFHDLRESNEADTQKIHELKRSLDTATAAQAYLSQELEQYTNSDNCDIENELHKTQADLLELKKKYGKLEVSYTNLQQDYNTLLEENTNISKSLEEALKNKEHLSAESETKISEDDLLRIQILETENMDLLQKIENFEERTVRYTLTIAEYERNIEILRDQILCLEENLQSKRTDLEEKVQILESTQEQLAEANSKIAVLSAAPENVDRKGNSLFAEVDDQRQAMKQLLAAQKKSYLQMKKIYNESEHEIRRLKRENISMHTELEACSSIFCNADKIYQEKLNERVRHLLNQNEDLERKLKWTQDRLKELAREKGVLWLDSMLSFCKKETDDLKSQLHSVRIQKACLEEQLRNAQQDMARWRFESLKSRCLLLDREGLLTENKITFKPMQAMEYNISERDQEEARPRIVSSRHSNLESFAERKSITPLKVFKKEMESPLPTLNECQIDLENNSVNERKDEAIINDENLACNIMNKLVVKEDNTAILREVNINAKLDVSSQENPFDHEDKENSSFRIIEDFSLPDKFAKLKAEPPSPMRPSQRSLKKTSTNMSEPPVRSILSKQDDFILKDSYKMVKFSSKEDIVHNCSLDTLSPNNKRTTNQNDDNSSSSKLNCKQSRSKTNVVVRRVVVSSKHD